jgi:hypothetical protein
MKNNYPEDIIEIINTLIMINNNLNNVDDKIN